MFEKFRKKSATARLLEEQFYEQVALELSNGQKRNGLWVKAVADSNGLEEKAKALYIQYRVRSIKDEIEILSDTLGEAEKHSTSPQNIYSKESRGNNQPNTSGIKDQPSRSPQIQQTVPRRCCWNCRFFECVALLDKTKGNCRKYDKKTYAYNLCETHEWNGSS